MLRHYFFLILSCVSLLAWGGAPISLGTAMDSFEYDLDSVHLKLEKLDARWQLSTGGDGRVFVEHLRAKRLIITMRDNQSSGNADLPEHLRLPFPLNVRQAEIAEVLIIRGGERHAIKDMRFSFSADSSNLRLDSLHANTPWGMLSGVVRLGTAKPFPVNGTLEAINLNGKLPYDINIQLSGDLETLQFASASVLNTQDGKMVLLQGEDRAHAAGFIQARGSLGLSGQYPLVADIRVTDVHPERLGAYPTANISFDLGLKGALQPEAALRMQVALRDSEWRGRKVSGEGAMAIAGNQIRDLDLHAKIAANTMAVSGSLGNARGMLRWNLDFPELEVLGEGYGGHARANGTLTGDLENPDARLTLLAEQLQLPGKLSISHLEGHAALAEGANGKLDGEINSAGLHYGQYSLEEGRLTLQGTRANHRLALTASGNEQKIESVLQGGLSTGLHWTGWLQSLSCRCHPSSFSLQSPASLAAGMGDVTLGSAVIQLTKGRVFIDHLHMGGGMIESKGRLENLAWAEISPLLPKPAQLRGDLTMSGRWDFEAGNLLNGKVDLWRKEGDLILAIDDGKENPFGLQQAKIGVEMSNNHVTLNAMARGNNIGNLDIQVATTLARVGSGFSVLANAPLSLNASAELQTLSWLPLPSELVDASMDGQLSLSAQANGRWDEPHLSGHLQGTHLQFSMPSEGVAFDDGKLEATFVDDKLLIKQASWRGGDGRLQAGGLLQMESGQPVIALDWTADRFTAISRADRLLVLNGSGKTTLGDGMLMVSGNVVVAKGQVELASQETPKLSEDVIVLGQTASAPESEMGVLLNNLHIDLGKEFNLRGYGLDAKLAGSLTLTGLTRYHPHSEGSIQVNKGTYMAYGQVLNIERGILNFSGPLDNPGLNIRAMRNSKPVNAGIEIAGSAFQPATKLVSDPDVPESDKLSWLVLGHGIDSAGKNDYAMLSLAAGALLSQGQSVPLQTKIAHAVGLDEFGISGGNAENAVVTVGKRLSSGLFLSYEKSVSGLLDIVRLTYNITSRWSLRAESGTESAVDILYSFRFN